ncbi:MAG: transporter substrate-binding domain-containing protein [Azonexus sp.]
MHWFKTLLIGLFSMLFAACGEQGMSLPLKRPLPFPTPAQHDLIVAVSSGPLTYYPDDQGAILGLEHDLIEAFALELGVGVKYLVVPPDEIAATLDAGKAHLGVAWLPAPADSQQKATPPILQTADVLVQHEASLPLDDKDDLRGRTVHAMPGSRQLATLRDLQKQLPDLQVVEYKDSDLFGLLEALGKRKVELVAIDSTLIQIAAQFVPSLQATLELNENRPVVWWLGAHPNVELLARINAFVERVQRDGTLLKIEDRYFGHVRRLKQVDIVTFLGRVETVLPKLRKHFQAAQMSYGIDWRLIAAVAYHESHWEAEATSPTGVRGIMMLTEDTADRLGVGNRLDARDSIMGGARYLNLLKENAAGGCRRTRPHLAGARLVQHRPRSFQRGARTGQTARGRSDGVVRNEADIAAVGPAEILRTSEIRPCARRRGCAAGREHPRLLRHPGPHRACLRAGFAAHGRHDRHAGQ